MQRAASVMSVALHQKVAGSAAWLAAHEQQAAMLAQFETHAVAARSAPQGTDRSTHCYAN